MSRFSCIGPDCEDSCCAGWAIPISKDDHRRLTVIMGASRIEEVTTNENGARPLKDEWTPGHCSFEQDDQGRCHFLGQDDLCEMQRDFGEEALTRVCSLYPRHQHQFSQRLERSATLACPEAARLCLLSEGAMDLVEFVPSPSDILSRPGFYTDSKDQDAMRSFDLLRGSMYEIVGHASLPLGDRLCLLLVMSESGQGLLQAGARPDVGALNELVSEMRSPLVRKALLQSIAGIKARGTAVNVAISHVLCGTESNVSARMAALTEGVLQQYSLTDAALDGALDDETFARVCLEYEKFRDAAVSHQERIETYFTHYAKNYLLQEPYIDQRELKLYLGELVLRIASLRFLFLSDPRTVELCAKAADEGSEKKLDAVAVEVFRSFAREIEHTPAISQKLHGLLSRLGANAFGDFVCLTRL